MIVRPQNDEDHRDDPSAVVARDRVEPGERRGHDRAVERLEPRLVERLPEADRAADERERDRREQAGNLAEAEAAAARL